jgi:hypothetical protein
MSLLVKIGRVIAKRKVDPNKVKFNGITDTTLLIAKYLDREISLRVPAGGSGDDGAILLATTYDPTATESLLICSEYDPTI